MKNLFNTMFRCWLLAALSVLLSLSPGVTQGAELGPQRDGVVEKVSISTPEFRNEAATTVYWQKEIQKTGSQYLRLRIAQVRRIGDNEIILELRDRGGYRVRDYTGAELHKRGAFWTVVIPGDYVLLSLFAARPPVGFSITIDRVAYQAYSGAPLSTWGEDEKEPIANYANDPVVAAVERSVARLLFMKNGAPHTCTGFLIESGQLVTNHHCVSTQATCDTAVAVFGYQYDANGLLNFGEQFECAQVVPEKGSYELDYALLNLHGNAATKWGTLALKRADPQVDRLLFIVQHPGGQPKQISKINCVAKAVPVNGRACETDFTHTCDTVGGSSGSPVFNEVGQVIGLHHYGFGTGGEWNENRAIRMSQIVDHLGY